MINIKTQQAIMEAKRERVRAIKQAEQDKKINNFFEDKYKENGW